MDHEHEKAVVDPVDLGPSDTNEVAPEEPVPPATPSLNDDHWYSQIATAAEDEGEH
jgi:hypothetical protein